MPGTSLPKEQDWMEAIGFDKLVHIGLIAVFAWLLCRTLKVKKRKDLVLVFLSCVLYGLLVEVIQEQFTIHRAFDLMDVVADSIGAFLGVLIWKRWYKTSRSI